AHALRDGFGKVGVVEQDVGRFAAKFLRDAFDGQRRVLRDGNAGTRRAGERHHVDVRVRGQRDTDAWTVALNEVEHTRRYAGFIHHFGKDHRIQRRDLGRLENHRAAGGDRRRDLRGDLVEWPVPRRDQRTDADRFVDDEVATFVLFPFERLHRV